MATNQYSAIPVTVTLPGQPRLQKMIVSASQVYRVVKSKDLNSLAKQFLKERKRTSEKRKLSKKFSKPSGLKFKRTGDDYKIITGSDAPTNVVNTLGWDEPDDDLQPEPASLPIMQKKIIESELESEVPILSLKGDSPNTETVPPVELDLSTITPRPQYTPEKQPDHLKASNVQKSEKTALECYKDKQKDVKEITKGCHELIDPERIVRARPDGQVELENGSKGLIEIKSPTSAQELTISEAVKQRKIKFLAQDHVVETTFNLKENDNYYHQVQAELYAGEAEGFTFCDFVVYLQKTESICIHRNTPDFDWQDMNIPKIREFCLIYNDLLKKEEGEGPSRATKNEYQ